MDQVLCKLLQLVALQSGERLADRGAQFDALHAVDAVEAEGDQVAAPFCRRLARTFTRHDLLPVKGDRGGVGRLAQRPAGDRGREVEADLKRFPDRLRLVHVLASVELFCGAICQAGVQPDVFLLLWEAVEGDPELERLGHGWVEPFDGLEGNRGGHFSGRHLGEGEHVAVPILRLGRRRPPRDRTLLPPSSPVVHHRLGLRNP